MTDITTKLLKLTLIIMPSHAGICNPIILGGGKNIQRYPPTKTPITNDATTEAGNSFSLYLWIIYPAIRLAKAPKTTSIGLINQ